MFKKILSYTIVFSLVFNNLAFATQQIIELDVQGSQTPQRLHTILPRSNIEDVSHIEIDADNQKVVVHKKNNVEEIQTDGKIENVIPVNAPIILQKWNVHNLLWDQLLREGILQSFLLNHTAWLTPLDEGGYKLEFKLGLRGGMKNEKDCKEECIHYEGVCFPMSVLEPFFPSVLGNLANFVKEAALKPNFMTATGKQPFLRDLRADAIKDLINKPDYEKLREIGQEAFKKKVFGWMAAEVYEMCKAKLINTQQEYNLPHEVLLNTNGYLSILNGITGLVYPIFEEDRSDPKNADKTYLIEPSILEKLPQAFRPSLTLGIEQHFNRIAADYIQVNGGDQKAVYQREVAPIGKLLEEKIGNVIRKTNDYTLNFADTSELQMLATVQLLGEHLRRTELPASIGNPLIATVLQASPYMKDTVLDEPMREILQHYMEEKKVDPAYKVAFDPLFYTGRMFLRDMLSQVQKTRDYTLSYKKDGQTIYWNKNDLQSHLYQFFRDYTKASRTNGSTTNLDGVDKDGAITWGLAGRLLYKSLDLLKSSEKPVYPGSKYLLTQNKKGALSVSSPSNPLTYNLFAEDRSVGDSYLPNAYTHDGLLDKPLLETVYQYINETLTKSPYKTTHKEYIREIEPAFYIVRSALRNALQEAEKSYVIKDTRISLEKQVQNAMINHLLLTPLAEQDKALNISKTLMPLLFQKGIDVLQASKLSLVNKPNQYTLTLNLNRDLSSVCPWNGLLYPLFPDDRMDGKAFLPLNYVRNGYETYLDNFVHQWAGDVFRGQERTDMRYVWAPLPYMARAAFNGIPAKQAGFPSLKESSVLLLGMIGDVLYGMPLKGFLGKAQTFFSKEIPFKKLNDDTLVHQHLNLNMLPKPLRKERTALGNQYWETTNPMAQWGVIANVMEAVASQHKIAGARIHPMIDVVKAIEKGGYVSVDSNPQSWRELLNQQDNPFGNQVAEWAGYDLQNIAHQIYDGYSKDLGKSIVSMVVHPRILDDVLTKVGEEKPELKHLRQILRDRGIQVVSNDPDFLMTFGYAVRHLVHNDLLGGVPFGQFLKTMVAEWSKPKIFSTPIREAIVKTLETPVEEEKPKVLIFPEEHGKAKILITYPAEDTGMQILTWEVPDEALNKIPEGLKAHAEPAKHGDGIRWESQDGRVKIRIMRGKPDAEHNSQKVDYVVLKKDGFYTLTNGNQVKGKVNGIKARMLEEAHIPLSEWLQWRTTWQP